MAKCLKHVSTVDSKTTKSSGSTVEKSFLLIADSNDHQPENTGWYVAKVSSPSVGEHRNNKKRKRNSKRRFHPRGTIMDPIWKTDSPFGCCFAVIGSTIYKIGGGKDSYHTPTWDIYEADVGHDLRKWNRVSSRMISKRNSARAVVVHEKIYVFGGFMPRDSTSTSANSPRPRLPWAEVYDPKLNLWSPLSEPPTRLNSGCLFAAYDVNSSKKESKNKIIVGSGSESDPLLSYDVTNNTWEIIDDKFEILTNFTCPVLLDNRLYWIGYRLVVYDLKLKEMYEGPIIGDYDNFDQDLREYPDCSRDYQRVFFHIVGDVFCFCWLRCLTLGDQICCTTIRISSKVIDRRRNGRRVESFKARCLSTQRYWVDQRVYFLGGLLL